MGKSSEYARARHGAENTIGWRFKVHPKLAKLLLRERMGILDPADSPEVRLERLAEAVVSLIDGGSEGIDREIEFLRRRAEREDAERRAYADYRSRNAAAFRAAGRAA